MVEDLGVVMGRTTDVPLGKWALEIEFGSLLGQGNFGEGVCQSGGVQVGFMPPAGFL